MPKKDNPNPKAPTSEDEEDSKLPTKSTGAIPKSRSYAGPQETEARGRRKATGSKSEDESDDHRPGASGLWQGRTRSSAKPEEGTKKMSLLGRMRSKSKSKSPTKRDKSPPKREKSRSKSPAKEKGKRTKSPSPHRRLFGRRKKSKSPTKKDAVPEEQEKEEEEEQLSEEEEHRGEPITPMGELKTILESSAAGAVRSLTVRPGPDTVQLLTVPPDSTPLVSRADLYKANLGKLPDPNTCIELKEAKGSPVEEDNTTSSSLSFTSLVQGVQLDDDSSLSLASSTASLMETKKSKKKKK